MRELNKYKKKKFLTVISQVEVFAFPAYMFESLQSFNNSQVKITPCFLCHTYSQYVKTAEPLPLTYVTKLHSLLRRQLNCRTSAIGICYLAAVS